MFHSPTPTRIVSRRRSKFGKVTRIFTLSKMILKEDSTGNSRIVPTTKWRMIVATNTILRRSLRAKAPIPRLSIKKNRGSSTRAVFIIDKEERALNKHHLNKE